MSDRSLDIQGRKVWVAENGDGEKLIYLHGFADIHGSAMDWLPFHKELQKSHRVIAPAHPGCATTDEYDDIDVIDDVVFHYLEVMDALEIDSAHFVGSCIGGWIAAEIAARHPRMVKSLALIGASGLFVSGQPIGDLFMMAQSRDGGDLSDLRRMLFTKADVPQAIEMFPDGRGDLDQEMLRYQMFRFASRVGFQPPYFYNFKLRNRLHRITSPTLVLWGKDDHLVPLSHGEAYADSIDSAELKLLDGGHSIQVERPEETAALVTKFLAT